jgi:hypothetical protein
MTHNCIPFIRPQTSLKNNYDNFIRLTEDRPDLDKTRIRQASEKIQRRLNAEAVSAKARAKKAKLEKKVAEARRTRYILENRNNNDD